MSRIYFSDREEEVAVRGTERAFMGLITRDLAMGVMGDYVFSEREAFYRSLLKPGHYLLDTGYRPQNWFSSFKLAFGGLGGESLELDGKPLEAFSMTLNTALQLGNDELKLMARLHGQCEIHAYVEGPDRAWLAGIIENGLAHGTFRSTLTDQPEGPGWDKVVDLLRARDDMPVVTSYSVCDVFPDPWEMGLKSDDNEDFEIDHDVLWDRGIEWLHENAPRLDPNAWSWPGYHFRHGVSTFDLAHLHDKDQLRALMAARAAVDLVP